MAKGVAASDRADLISRAVMTLKDGRHDPRFGNAKTLFARARAIMVVPQPIKGGVFVGGVGANGILTTHHASDWIKLSFYALGAVSCWMRIGVEVAEVAIVVMNNRAFNAWMTDKVTLGAQAGITLEGSINKPRT